MGVTSAPDGPKVAANPYAALREKVVLITGGGTGIGKAAALEFAKYGAKVVIGNRRNQTGEQVVAEIERAGGEATFLRTDVSVEDDVRRLVEHASETFGGVDIAFNNAGVLLPEGPTGEVNLDNARTTIEVNVLGVLYAMRYEIPAMLERGGGTIINTSSVLGSSAAPGLPAYVASKHAVIGLTRAAALEYGKHGVRVNALSPALTETEMAHDGLLAGETEEARQAAMQQALSMHPIGRLGSVDDMARAAVWLASDQSGFVLGQSLNVDGGWLAF